MLFLKVKGSEKCTFEKTRTRSVSDGKGGRRTEYYYVTKSGREQFFRHKVPIFNFLNGTIFPG